MGRSEEKSRKRHSPSIPSEDENRSKKHRTRDDRERKGEKKTEKKKDERKEKDKSKKSHRSSTKREERGMKSDDKRNRKHSKSNRYTDFKELSNDDYFAKNNEFSTWLKEEKGLFFSDLSSEDARKLFSGFVKDWNSQKLQSHYYEGITTGPRSAHNWKFK
ncbi:style cell-cycle inhibitor 1-A [Magnolia sinica]|uniref:style cell-cycle inhibitor 1-A n=1 Tax=Magnolia sinica TaxID=86752 RepID=UPI002659EE9E|nr:style cell-cycle inhibitor 1-A [Magnolia sinica]